MTTVLRERDVVTLVKGSTSPVLVDSSMTANGWAGGQGVTWIDSTFDEFMVTYSDGTYGGFLLWGSNEDSDQFISSVGSQQKYQYGTLCTGTWVICVKTYEHYTYASRQAGPLVALTYTVGERLRFSLRGLFTKEDEWALSADPRAPNELFIGMVAQIPSAANKYYMTIQTSF